jgi:hypothetical protein
VLIFVVGDSSQFLKKEMRIEVNEHENGFVLQTETSTLSILRTGSNVLQFSTQKSPPAVEFSSTFVIDALLGIAQGVSGRSNYLVVVKESTPVESQDCRTFSARMIQRVEIKPFPGK